jgi:thiol:disulfide interchange protein DsbC
MMKLKAYSFALLLLTGLISVTSTSSFAQTSVEAKIRSAMQANLREGTKIDSVTKTPYGGLYEVRVGSEIFYIDEKAQVLIIGNMLDMKTGVNYTQQKIDEANRIKFSDLPFELALKTVKGDGKRQIATFEDPNCGPCKQFRANLKDLNNVTIYTFMYTILAEDSEVKARNIWCSANRNKAWEELMLSGKEPAAAPAKCEAPNEKVLALGRKLRVRGTPTIFFEDGLRTSGAVEVKQLEEKFASLKVATTKAAPTKAVNK